MLTSKHAFGALCLTAVALVLSACSNGGELNLEPGARKDKTQGSPFVQLNSGGKALIIEQGKTATTGVHGWVTVQPISSTQMTSSSGTKLILNKTSL